MEWQGPRGCCGHIPEGPEPLLPLQMCLSVPQDSLCQLSPMARPEPAAETWVYGAGRAPLVPSMLAVGIPSTQLCYGLHHQPGRAVGGTQAPALSRASRSLPGCSIRASMLPSAPRKRQDLEQGSLLLAGLENGDAMHGRGMHWAHTFPVHLPQCCQ